MGLWNWIFHPIDSFKNMVKDKLNQAQDYVTGMMGGGSNNDNNQDNNQQQQNNNNSPPAGPTMGMKSNPQQQQNNDGTDQSNNNGGISDPNAKSNNQSNDQSNDQSKDNSGGGIWDGIKGFLGGGLGLVIGIILLLVKGIASLFGADLNLPSFDNPAGNVIQQTASKVENTVKTFVQPAVTWVKDKVHSAVDWVKGKWDNFTGAPGIRNNNPGNMVASPENKKWNGEIGKDGRFAVFRTTQEGARAMGKNIIKYADDHHYKTLADITKNWAPKGDGKNDPINYAQTVADNMSKTLGRTVSVNETLNVHDDKTLALVMKSMAQVENGKNLPYSDEVFAYGARAALNMSVADPSKLVQDGSGKYTVDNVNNNSSLVAMQTPTTAGGNSGGFKKAIDQVYNVS